jgi:hypothetical protein
VDELWSFLIEPLIREADPGEICLSGPAGPLSERVRSLALRRSLGSYARLAVVDGNPNWYSVHQALTRLAAEPRFPLVFVDAVGWPYGHRDGYVAPDAIPLEHRNAWRRQGMLPYRGDLAELGGVNPERCNGVFSHGSCNGVAAAIAEFAKSHPEVRSALIPGFQPLGVLAGPETPGRLLAEVLLDPNRALARRGFFRAAADARRIIAAPMLDRAQRRIIAPNTVEGENVTVLAPPEPSGDSLRDNLRAALTGHPLLAQLLRCVDHVFREAGIAYAVAEGTLLGTVRHAGLLPHDDDVDIVVRREDVPRMLEVAKQVGWIGGEGAVWPQIGPIAFICPDETWITEAGLWHRMPVVDVFPVSTSTTSPILSATELADCERRPFCDFTVSAPRAALAVIARQYGPRALDEVSVWRRGGNTPPALLPLHEYQQVCADEGYVAARTLDPGA